MTAIHIPFPAPGPAATEPGGIRDVIEAQPTHTRDDHRQLQYDARSLRAVACLPGLCKLLEEDDRSDVRQAVALLAEWNGDCLPELAAPTIFNVFFVDWCQAWQPSDFPRRP